MPPSHPLRPHGWRCHSAPVIVQRFCSGAKARRNELAASQLWLRKWISFGTKCGEIFEKKYFVSEQLEELCGTNAKAQEDQPEVGRDTVR